MERSHTPFGYETLKLSYVIHHTYSPDFILENGVIIECKGRFRDAAEIAKMRAIKVAYPDLDIRMLFMDGSKRILNQKTTHSQWSERHGFPWAEGKVPEDWLKLT